MATPKGSYTDVLVTLQADLANFKSQMSEIGSMVKTGFNPKAIEMFNTALGQSAGFTQREINAARALIKTMADIDAISSRTAANKSTNNARELQAQAKLISSVTALNRAIRQKANEEDIAARKQEAHMRSVEAAYQRELRLKEQLARTARANDPLGTSSDRVDQIRRELSEERSLQSMFAGMTREQAIQAGYGKTIAAFEAERGKALSFSNGFMGNLITRTAQHVIQWGALLVSMQAVQEAVTAITDTYNEMISKGSEFQTQAILFQASQKAGALMVGGQSPQVGTDQYLGQSISLASKYGDNINDVAQDIALWTKRTNDNNAALYMTNEALEFQLATGTSIEDFYKTVTGLAQQWAATPLVKGDKMGFDLSQTHELMQRITSAALAMGAGLHQAGANGQEMTGGLNNGAIILLKSLDQDAAALSTLGYVGERQIGVNAALIQAFGNTGVAAEEAGDRVSRLTAGIAELSNPGKVKKLTNLGFNIEDLKAVFNTGGDVIKNFAELVNNQWVGVGGATVKLTTQQKDFLETLIASPRQFEAVRAILATYNANLKQVTDSTKNLGAEDDLAKQMGETYRIETARLSAEWEGFLIVISQGVLPMLESFVGYLASTVIPMIAEFSQGVKELVNDAATAARLPAEWRAPWEKGNSNDKSGFNRDVKSLTQEQLADRENYDTGPTGQGYTATRQYHDKYGHIQSETRRYVSKAAFYTSGDRAFGAPPASAHPELASRAGILALENAGNNLDVGERAVDQATKDALRRASHPQPVEPPGTPIGDPTASTKGMASAAEDERVHLAALDAAYNDLLERKKSYVDVVDDEISATQELIRANGATPALTQKLIDQEGMKAMVLSGENVLIRQHTADLQKMASADLAQAKRDKPGSKQRDTDMLAYYQVETQIRAETRAWDENAKAIQGTKNETEQALREKNTYLEKQAGDKITASIDRDSSRIADDKEAISAATSLGEKQRLILQLHNDTAAQIADEAKAVANIDMYEGDEGKRLEQTAAIQKTVVGLVREEAEQKKAVAKATYDANQSLIKDTITAHTQLGDALLEHSGAPADQITYYKEVMKVQQQAEEEQQKYQELQQQFAGTDMAPVVEQWKTMEDQINADELAAAKFQQRIDQIKNSFDYQALDKIFEDIATTISQTVTRQLDGNTAEETAITNLNIEISNLRIKKEIIDATYNETKEHTAIDIANQVLENRLLDQQIEKIQQRAEAIKYSQEHPGLFKQVTTDFAKDITTQLLTNLKTQALNNIFNIKPDNTALSMYKDYEANNTTFATQMKSLADQNQTTYNNFVSAANTLAHSMDNFVSQARNQSAGQNTSSAQFAGSGWQYESDGLPGIDKYDSSGYPNALQMDLVALGGTDVTMLPSGTTDTVGGDSKSASSGGINLSGLFSSSGGGGSALGSILGAIGLTSGKSDGVTQIGSLLSMLGGGLKGPAGTGGGLSSGTGNLGGILQGVGNITAAFGQSTDAGLGSLLGGLGFLGGPVVGGITTAVGGMLGGMLGPHYNDTTNPDMDAQDGYAQGIANLQGSAYTSATGKVTEDPNVSQELGGQTELQYLDQFVTSHPGGAGLTGASLQEWQTVSQMTGGGTASGVLSMNQGNVQLGNASGQAVGTPQNWQSLLNAFSTATQNVNAFASALSNASNQALVSLNQYGGSSGAFAFNYNTPGYGFAPLPGGISSATTAANTAAVQNALNPVAINSGGSSGQVLLTSVTNLDGRTIAKTVQAYQIQAKTQNYKYIV